MNSVNSTFSTTTLRWAIYSFVDDSADNKKKFSEVLQHLKFRRIFSTEVIPRIKVGTRLVGTDYGRPCSNCYHYGQWPSAGSERGLCMNHCYEKEVETVWMTFEEFVKRSRNHGGYSTYEEYDIECRIKFKREEDEQERYIRESERAITAYYAGLVGRNMH